MPTKSKKSKVITYYSAWAVFKTLNRKVDEVETGAPFLFPKRADARAYARNLTLCGVRAVAVPATIQVTLPASRDPA